MAETQEDRIERGGRRWRPVWVHALATILVWAIVLALFIRFFASVRVVLLGLLAAGAVAAMLYPLVRALAGPRPLRGVAVGVGFLLLIAGLLALLGWLLAQPIQHELARWPQIRTQLNDLLARWSRALGLEQTVDVQTVANQVIDFLTGTGGAGVVTGTANALVGFGIALAFTFIGSIYLLADHPDRLLRPVLAMLPEHRRQPFHAALTDLVPRLRWWLLGAIGSIIIVGLASGIGYWAIGLQFALPLAVLAGFAEIVPTIGPLAAFAVALVFAIPQGWGQVTGVLIVYAVIQLLESYVILPLVMRGAVNIPPVVTLFTVVLWGKVFGAAGLLLAIPIDLAIWSFARHFLMDGGRRQALGPAPPAGAEPTSRPP